MKKEITYSILISLLLAISLACQIHIGGPELPSPAVPISSDAAQSLAQVWQAAVENPSGDVIALTLDEEQVSSAFSYWLQSQPNPTLYDPQVLFRNGQAEIYGQLREGWLIANIHLTAQVALDENFQPVITITGADFGPLPVPESLKNSVSTMINQTLTGALAQITTGFTIENIIIADGMVTIAGRKP